MTLLNEAGEIAVSRGRRAVVTERDATVDYSIGTLSDGDLRPSLGV